LEENDKVSGGPISCSRQQPELFACWWRVSTSLHYGFYRRYVCNPLFSLV
jgi:hypothetical protein